jgi:lycopene cyclase domain-containing protein
LSFDKKLRFYTQWKELFIAILVVAVFYILADIYMTKNGVWGFNPRYHSTLVLYKLPIEEWLFFIVIPYASIFLHEAFILYFPFIKLSKSRTKYITFILIFFLGIVFILNYQKAYTAYISGITVLSLIFSIFDKSEIISRFYITFLLILIPFIAVNAILTGSLIENEVVWYNNSENLGLRFLTIPIEDFAYAFSLIMFNLLLKGLVKRKLLV